MDLRYAPWLFTMGVSPFGNPRIEAYLQLPVAYRSLSRPSSAPDAKAFTLCSFSLELPDLFRDLRCSLNCLSFQNIIGIHIAVKRLSFYVLLESFPPCGQIVFYPTFLGKTNSNLLKFVL